MVTLARLIDNCLATTGTSEFAPAFCHFVETLGSDQIMVFAIEGNKARCLLSRHFRKDVMAEKLAAQYLDGWFLKDPLLPDLLAIPPGKIELRKLDEFSHRMSKEYRQNFFDMPGLLSKTTLLAVGSRLRLFVSLYQAGDGGFGPDPDLARLAGRLALAHFECMADTGTPAPLDVLSDRERAVCLGILSGRKAEAIAADIGLAASTVVTYRKRAYAKLGIASRTGLFAICRE